MAPSSPIMQSLPPCTMLQDLPIALRRTRRRSAARKPEACDVTNHKRVFKHPPSSGPVTPKRGPKKRVRFSDPGPPGPPGPSNDHQDEAASTGLTPHILRTTLEAGVSGGKKKRRHSGPMGLSRPELFDSTIDTRYSCEVTFLPLRQVLDGRVKRRIRRNGLSEEINMISAEKRQKAKQNKEEMAALRAQIAEKDAEIRRLSGATEIGEEEDAAGVDDLKKQVTPMMHSMHGPVSPHSTHSSEHTVDFSNRLDWAGAVPDPLADRLGVDLDLDLESGDDEFGDRTVAGLACSTPSHRRTDPNKSFPTPPPTSPPPPAGPGTPCRRQVVSPTNHVLRAAAVQTSFTEADRQELEEELASLQLEMTKLTGTLEMYEAVTSRLSDKLSPFAPSVGSAAALIMDSRSPAVKVEAQLNNLLQAFADRTAAMACVDSSLTSLGFPGADAAEVLSSLCAALRTARLELEYLTPGEITLPLTATGAAVLDLLLARLRDMARRTLECEDAIDEYRALETSLRQQLRARVDAMDTMRRAVAAAEARARSNEERACELQAGAEKLQSAVKSYTRDVAELEALVRQLEGDLDAANRELQGRAGGDGDDDCEEEGAVRETEAAVAALEEKLGLALGQAAGLRDQLAELGRQQAELRAGHAEEMASVAARHGADLAERDARLSALRADMDRVNEELRGAHDMVRGLRLDNGVLHDRVASEKTRTIAAVSAMKKELERVVTMGQDLLVTPKKGAST